MTTPSQAVVEAHRAAIPRNGAGTPLCARCNDEVPEDMRFSVYNPEESVISNLWGPWCSEECLCYTKICSNCDRDFYVDGEGDKAIKYFGNGTWLCSCCSEDMEECGECGSSFTSDGLKEVEGIKYCKSCYKSKFFTCNCCKEENIKKEHHIKNLDSVELATNQACLDEYGSEMCTVCFLKERDKFPKSEIKKCKCCDNIYGSSEVLGDYCKNCRERDKIITCGICKQEHHLFNNIGDTLVCAPCEGRAIRCEVCNKHTYFKKDRKLIRNYKDHYICNDCNETKNLFECPSCLSLTTEKLKTMKNGIKTCRGCRPYRNYCSKCKSFHHDEEFCRLKDARKSIKNYSYRPKLFFNHSYNLADRVYFGFENEMNYETSGEESKAMNRIYENYPSTQLYLKGDGSISGPGFEVVSMPMNLSFFNKEFSSHSLFFHKAKKNARSCGLHVHFDRSSFDGRAHLYKVIAFIKRASAFSIKIAGRKYGSYNHEMKDKAVKYVKKKVNGDRYNSVNLSNKDTVEFRMFQNCIDDFQLRYRIEFLHSLIEYTRTANLKVGKEDEYVKWLREQPKYYYIKKFIKKNLKSFWT